MTKWYSYVENNLQEFPLPLMGEGEGGGEGQRHE